MRLKAINPATEKVLKEFELFSKQKVFKVVKDAQAGFEFWRKTEILERERFIRNFLLELEKETEKIAKLITTEMGKPITEARTEAKKAGKMTNWFLQNTRKFIQNEKIDLDSRQGLIRFTPRGVMAAITPWNYPLTTSLEKIIPALLTGNTVVFKPSELSTLSGLKLDQIFKRIKLPKNIFNTITGDHRTGKFLVQSGVNMISFTGSTAAGKDIAQSAGKDLKKVVLELGGSDPFIVFEDAPLEPALEAAIKGRFRNCGQICTSAKRILVQKGIYSEFLSNFLKRAQSIKVGDPQREETEMGPLVSKGQLRTLQGQVKDALQKGAKLLLGGRKLNRTGYFYAPTILTDITEDMLVAKQEVFGPVACIFKFDNLEEALEIANSTKYGLGASVWTKDQKKIKFMTQNIQSGGIAVNCFGTHELDLPFGGVKQSGLGRELSRYGILEFCNLKTVILKKLF